MKKLPLDQIFLNQDEITRLKIFQTIQPTGPVTCKLRWCKRNTAQGRKCPRFRVDGDFVEFYDWKPVDSGTLLKCNDNQYTRRSKIAVYSPIPALHITPSYKNGRVPLTPTSIYKRILVEAGACTSDFASPPPELIWLNETPGQSVALRNNSYTVSKKRNTKAGTLTSVVMHLDFYAVESQQYDYICQMKFWQALNGTSRGRNITNLLLR